MINAIEKRARELLAAEYERRGSRTYAESLRETPLCGFGDDDSAMAIRAIIAALTPQWQSIETVPHGKWVYVGTVGAPCGGVAMLADYWINPDMRPDQYAERATHWMPLPDAPGGD